jgi:hypothetical protein
VVPSSSTKNAPGGTAAGLGLRSSSDIHAFGDSNLYLRKTSDRLLLSSEHRAAPAARAVYLELVATEAQTTHLEVLGDVGTQQRRDLQTQVLDLLTQHPLLTRAKLRQMLSVKNERLGEALEALLQTGRISRTPTGWQATR